MTAGRVGWLLFLSLLSTPFGFGRHVKRVVSLKPLFSLLKTYPLRVWVYFTEVFSSTMYSLGQYEASCYGTELTHTDLFIALFLA